MSITIGEVLPESRVSNFVLKLPVENFVMALLLSENYADFHRFLNELLDSGKISRDEYEEISSLVAELILEERIDKRVELIKKIDSMIAVKDEP